MTDTTTLAPCPFCGGATRYLKEKTGFWTERAICDACDFCLTRTHTESAVARWNRCAPAPASGEPETCKCCGEGSARIVVRRECDTCTSVYAGVVEHRLQKSLAAPPAQGATQ